MPPLHRLKYPQPVLPKQRDVGRNHLLYYQEVGALPVPSETQKQVSEPKLDLVGRKGQAGPKPPAVHLPPQPAHLVRHYPDVVARHKKAAIPPVYRNGDKPHLVRVRRPERVGQLKLNRRLLLRRVLVGRVRKPYPKPHPVALPRRGSRRLMVGRKLRVVKRMKKLQPVV